MRGFYKSGRSVKRGSSIKMEVFFDYLRNNGYQDEIYYDEDHKQYIKVLEVKKSLSYEYFKERITKFTYLVKKFKDYSRNVYNNTK